MITVKCHAHLQALTKQTVKFQKGQVKIVRVAFTKLDTICDRQSDGQTDAQEKAMCLQTLMGGGGGRRDITVPSRFQPRCIFDLT